MSSLVLRSLLLPDNNQVQSINQKAKLNGLALDSTQAEDSNQSLSRLDSLRLSGFSAQATKGRVPIQLTAPAEIENSSQAVASKNSYPKTSGSPKLAALTGMTTSAKPVQPSPAKNNKNNTDLMPLTTNQGLADLTSYNTNFSSTISTSYTTSVSATKKVLGSFTSNVSNSISFVDGTDKTAEKMAVAIAKIQDWDRKIGALDACLEEQKKSKTDMSSTIITGSKRLTLARSDATKAREEAITSFNEAIVGINAETKATGMRSPLFNEYKTTRDQMEKMFSRTQEKDKTTMDKVTDYLKNTLTADNFNKALHFINPLSDKY